MEALMLEILNALVLTAVTVTLLVVAIRRMGA